LLPWPSRRSWMPRPQATVCMNLSFRPVVCMILICDDDGWIFFSCEQFESPFQLLCYFELVHPTCEEKGRFKVVPLCVSINHRAFALVDTFGSAHLVHQVSCLFASKSGFVSCAH
jgi:hypothetical protein